MKQMTLAATKGFEKHSRATRKAEFLARMENLMPWVEFCALIEPHYREGGEWPAAGRRGADAADVLYRQLVQPER